MKFEYVMEELESRENPKNVEGMARFGINPEKNLGISVTQLRKLAKIIGKNQKLAEKLWDTGIRDAKLVACFTAKKTKVTEELMEKWLKDFDSWDVCDTVCGSLFDKTEFAYKKAVEWSEREQQFQRRAGFAMMAWLAVHDKKADNTKFMEFFPVIINNSGDERNYVRKAVNWALRQIGKRNFKLNRGAIKTAEKLIEKKSKSSGWIGKNALKELKSEKVRERLVKHHSKNNQWNSTA